MVMDVNAIYDVPGCIAIRQYGQPPLDRFPFGTMLVAPCTFNTFNKIAHGLADTLGTAMLADALGRRCPTFIAPAMNTGLWHHPQTQLSLARLQQWGCAIIEPRIQPGLVEMAPIKQIFARLEQHFATSSTTPHGSST
jgi:phosphopantothenoylcysteine synthetase/decarboxylase